MIKIFDAFLTAFFPRRCAYCGKVIKSEKLCCDDCAGNLPRIEGDICRKCGREKKDCSCKKAEKYYDGIAAPFYFTGNVRKGIHAYKFRHWLNSAEVFGYEMSKTVIDRFADIDFDYVTAVPLTDKSRRERGYNQCELLADELSRHLCIEHRKGILSKIYETRKQHTVSSVFRKGNLSGVFEVNNPAEVENKTILLVDDISTTGETFNECSKMLWLYGAKSVYCISTALTPKKRK